MATLTEDDARARIPQEAIGKEVYITRDIWRIDQRIKQIKKKAAARIDLLWKRRVELVMEYERMEREGRL